VEVWVGAGLGWRALGCGRGLAEREGAAEVAGGGGVVAASVAVLVGR
jgi:hypothetical protein